MKRYRYPTVLTIAGFDSSGGAGIQADIKTISALGCYATSVLTALPVQNTQGVKDIFPIPVEAVSSQLRAIFEDIVPDAIKIGMVHTAELVEAIVQSFRGYETLPIVFDPVMVSTSGHRLMEEITIKTIVEKLFPLADVVTPNMDEAAILSGMKVDTPDDMRLAGDQIMELGCKSVLLKGGHQEGSRITSLFIDDSGKHHTFESVKFKTQNTHGSGCTLSSAIASFIAQGKDIRKAVELGQGYVHKAVKSGMDVKTGLGNGPLNHFFDPLKMIKKSLT
jgi:hydroxymethylpyrimidine/phosphomethylpyrimidine kinase